MNIILNLVINLLKLITTLNLVINLLTPIAY